MMEPYVIERTAEGERSMDLGSRLLKDRIIIVNGEVEDRGMNSVMKQLLYLNSLDTKAPIYMYINSPGGSVHAGQEAANTMDFISAPVYTICTSLAASMGAFLFSCGKKGHRYIFPMADVMLHQVSSGTGGNIQDQRVSLEYTENLNKRLMTRLAKNCGKTYAQIVKDTNRDLWLSPEQAVEYGIADHIITTEEELMKMIERNNKAANKENKKK